VHAGKQANKINQRKIQQPSPPLSYKEIIRSRTRIFKKKSSIFIQQKIFLKNKNEKQYTEKDKDNRVLQH